MKRRLPIGISDFKEVVERNYAYIDKTLLIQEICEQGTKVTLIPRPRRFGKTLNLSMLRYFFEKTAIDHSPLFMNFNIWKLEAYKELQGQYPVIFLTLKEVKDANWLSAVRRHRSWHPDDKKLAPPASARRQSSWHLTPVLNDTKVGTLRPPPHDSQVGTSCQP